MRTECFSVGGEFGAFEARPKNFFKPEFAWNFFLNKQITNTMNGEIRGRMLVSRAKRQKILLMDFLVVEGSEEMLNSIEKSSELCEINSSRKLSYKNENYWSNLNSLQTQFLAFFSSVCSFKATQGNERKSCTEPWNSFFYFFL